MSSQVCLNIGPRGASISLARPNKSPKKPITALIAAPTELAIAFHASVSAFRNTSEEFQSATNIAMTAATAATIAKIGASTIANAPTIASITPSTMPITTSIPPIASIKPPIKSIAPKIGGPIVMKIPANVAMIPINIPTTG